MSQLSGQLNKCLDEITALCKELQAENELLRMENQAFQAKLDSSVELGSVEHGRKASRVGESGLREASTAGLTDVPRTPQEDLNCTLTSAAGYPETPLPGAIPDLAKAAAAEPIKSTPKEAGADGKRGSGDGKRGSGARRSGPRGSGIHNEFFFTKFTMPPHVAWKWEHRTGFRNYTKEQNEKIELAYQSGYPKVRLKAGKSGATPMELFFADMTQYDQASGSMRKVMREGPQSRLFKLRRFVMEIWQSWYCKLPWRETTEAYLERREQLANESATAPEYRVEHYYHDTGISQAIARSTLFFAATMTFVLANSIWLWYDVDTNPAISWVYAKAEYKVMENVFCVFFTLELIIRFAAFENKCDCLKDKWFRFDLLLVILMALETWGFALLLVATDYEHTQGGLHNFTVLRLARIMRLARIIRLLKAVPEVLTMLQGMIAAIRAVFYTILLLCALLYVFAILFSTHVSTYDKDMHSLRETYFGSNKQSFWTLLVHGTFMDAVSDILVGDLIPNSTALTLYFLVFVFLSNFTMMNMLIGIICEVVTKAKEEQHEQFEHFLLRTNLTDLMNCYDRNMDHCLGKEEFGLLMRNAEVLQYIRDFGTDAKGVETIVEGMFEDIGLNPGCERLPFEDIINTVMRLRGVHSATVLDVIEMREYSKRRFQQLEDMLDRPQ